MDFQELIGTLSGFWAKRGCVVIQPWDIEKGAGTFNSATYLRALGPEPWSVAYVEPSRRPTDGRYGDNPNRLERHHQFQVLLKPSPKESQEIYLESLKAIGIDPLEHDIRFVEDNWESPTLGAWGLGWEVWCDGMEITQFTYFQQCGGHNLDPVAVELTYGLERIAMYLQNVENVYDLAWGGGLTYGDIRHAEEYQWSKHNFEAADVQLHLKWFNEYMHEAARLCKEGLVIPAYDYCLRCSHIFNILDARGAISVTERQAYILRVRETSKLCADSYLAERERQGFPLLKNKPQNAPSAPAAPAVFAQAASDEASGSGRGSFLLEVGCEEIPARLAHKAAGDLSALVEGQFNEWGLDPKGMRFESTPRRLVVSCDAVGLEQEEKTEEVKGPPVRIAFEGGSTDGALTQVGEAFRKKLNPGEDIVVLDTPKGPCIGVNRIVPRRSTGALLAEAMPGLLRKIHWPKPMRWDEEPTPFVRPLHWLVCCLGGRPVVFDFAGVRSGNLSRGHRFMAPAEFEVKDMADLEAKLEERKVVLSNDKRRERIRENIDAIAAELGGRVSPDADLLEEITNIVEWPLPIAGEFPKELLALPEQVIVTPMRVHQRYFPVLDNDDKLKPNFIVVAGTVPKSRDVVSKGNAKVLKARLDDARFFYDRDLESKLDELLPLLDKRIWLAQVGSIGDKTRRVVSLVEKMGGDKNAVRAATLSKCDLATNMVGEFPELQGEMGRTYAAKQGENADVSEALFECYLPRFAGDRLPEGLAGTYVALADRFDSIVGCFGVGLKPTGTQDPYALRRQGIAILNILTHTKQPVPSDLNAWLDAAFSCYGGKNFDPKVKAEILDFFADRLSNLYADSLPADIVSAVVASGSERPREVYDKIQAISAYQKAGKLEPVLATFKRISNITKGTADPATPLASSEPAETELAASYAELETRVREELSRRDYQAVIGEMAALRPKVDRFFDDILVMHEDAAVREGRLSLLCRVRDMFGQLADFSKIMDRKN